MAVTIAEIQKLRTMTGAGLADCKKALTEANGDMDQAIKLVRERGQAIAAKRSDREASEGCVLAGVNGGFGAIVALKCETDFVANNADFVALTQSILNKALAEKPSSIEALGDLKADDGRTITELVTERSGVTGEKVELGYYEFVNDAKAFHYIHPGNKLAAVVAFAEADANEAAAHNIAMQVAAMNPVALDSSSVPADVIEKELEVGREKARQEGKPENMLDKIAQGRLGKFYKESTLMEQEFIMDNKKNIKTYAKENGVTPTDFKRVTLNEE